MKYHRLQTNSISAYYLVLLKFLFRLVTVTVKHIKQGSGGFKGGEEGEGGCPLPPIDRSLPISTGCILKQVKILHENALFLPSASIKDYAQKV